ncbi:F-box domain-containing protein [Mycena venus]|uniref:F-box domain-containing protein n=1 Tax=Mycena venus TaxID=2733690 RepID=A0A8H6YFM7_9AGAR|nr:F-box domain-containing protein [Mycena venus]
MAFPFHSTWGTIFKVFNPDNPSHVALHAEMISTPNLSPETTLALKHLISALRRFPPEILAEIFLFCVADVQADDEPGIFMNQAPWVLGQVCGYWRKVACSTPRLWSQINIDFGPPSGSTNMIRLLELFLQRSGRCPLSVRVGSEDDKITSHPVLDMLMETSDRWEEAYFYLSPSLLFSLAPIKGHLGSLRGLEVCSYTVDGEEPHRIIEAFQIAPLLDSVRVTLENGVILRLPSEQLTYYRSKSEGFMKLAESLYCMRNLVVCFIEPYYKVLAGPLAIHLPNLRILHIYRGGIHHLPAMRATLLDSFIVPQLTVLRIECDENDDDIVSHLLALVLRSSCPLQNFSMILPRVIPGDILQFFQHTPKLAHIVLVGAPFTRLDVPNLRMLARIAASIPQLLPMFKWLEVAGKYLTPEVLAMVRWHLNHGLLLKGLSASLFKYRKRPVYRRLGGAALEALSEMRVEMA